MVEDPLLTQYLDTKPHPPSRDQIRKHLEHYTHYTGKTITQLVKEAWQELKKDIPPSKHQLPKYLDGYKEYREGLGHSPETVKSAVSKVRSCYHHFQIPLPLRRQQYQQDTTVTGELPKKEDLVKAVNHANDKYSAIILVQVTSGMGSAEVASLKGKHLQRGLEDYGEIAPEGQLSVDAIGKILNDNQAPVISWHMDGLKRNRSYVTFSTPEALRYIHQYLEYTSPRGVEDHLFPGYEDQPLQNKSISRYFKRLNDRMGWGKTGRSSYFRSQNLRKYFASAMEKTALGYTNTRRLLGHTALADGSKKGDLKHLRLLYRQSMQAVTIMDRVEVHEVTDQRVEELEARVRELEELRQELQSTH